MTHRTTSATPVSHVFPGRRAEASRPLTFDDILLMDAIRRENHCADTVCAYRHQCFCWGEFVATPRQAAPRAPHTPSTTQTAPNRPDCVCAACGALEGRLRGIEEEVRMLSKIADFESKAVRELVDCTKGLALLAVRLETRLSALEADGNGERG